MSLINQPYMNKEETNADVVFCIDATGSMDSCFDGIKDHLNSFLEGLQSAAKVDFRLRLIAYRDLHDPDCQTPWFEGEFTSSAEEFSSQLSAIDPKGGGDDAESTLDALFRAIHSKWRERDAHKTIVLVTDDDTHPTLHESTYSRPDNNISRVIQDFQELDNGMLFMVTPKYPLYEEFERGARNARQNRVEAIWYAEPSMDDEELHKKLEDIPWDNLLKMIGEKVSTSSTEAAQK